MNTFFCRIGLYLRIWLAAQISWFTLCEAAGTLSAGEGFAAAVTPGGALVTWGKNDVYQLGHSADSSPVPLPQSVGILGGPSSWLRVSVGNDFVLGLGADGVLYSWGSNTSGQLGNGSLVNEKGKPVPVALPDGSVIKDFVAGQAHGLALIDLPGEEGVVYAWGSNAFGQLGLGGNDLQTRSTPIRVSFANAAVTVGVRKIAATDNASFAIIADGSLWSWGSNVRGELGKGKKITSGNLSSAEPAKIGKSKAWSDLAGGARHVVGLQGKRVYVWGDNAFGQCARSPSTASVVLSPAEVVLPKPKGKPTPTITNLAAGNSHSLVLSSNGTVYGWGYNIRGELGRAPTSSGSNRITTPFILDQDDPTKTDPKKRIPLPPVDAIAAGGDFTVLATRESSYISFGANTSGQLGQGFVSSTRTGAGTVAQALVGQPNLSVSAPTPVSGTSVSGVPAFGTATTFGNLSLVVRNSGSVSTVGSYRVEFYLSSDAKLDAADRLLAAKVESTALPPATTRASSFTASELTVPEVAPGSYYLIGQVYLLDASGKPVPDIYTPDNGAGTAVVLSGPDLSTTGIVSLSNTLVEDGDAGFGSVSLVLTNVNLGKIPVGRSVRVEAFLSSDDTLQTSSDVLLKAMDFPVPNAGLSAGGSMPLDMGTITVPIGIDGGNYRLVFAINRDGVIAESGTASNFGSIGVRVAAHDLSVVAPVLPDAPLGSGSTLSLVTVTVQNLGAKAYPGDYSVELYVSASRQFDFTAISLGEKKTFSGGLAAQASRQAIWQDLVLPVTLKGPVYFYSRVNADVNLGDRFPANNQASVAASLEDPVFNFSDFLFPNTTSVEPGASLGSVSYKLTNNGPGALQPGYAVAVEVFLSTDGNLDRGSDVLLDQYSYAAGLAPGQTAILPGAARSLTIPDGVANGIYNLLFTFNADGGVSFLPSTLTAVRLNVGALDLKVTAPTLTNSQLGTSAIIPLTGLSVENSGGFAVPSGLGVEVYLSSDAIFDTADTLLAKTDLVDPVPASGSRAVSFADLTVPDLGQGPFFLISRIILPSGLVDTDTSNNTAATAVTLSRPSLTIENLATPVELDLDVASPVLAEISFDIVNNSPGVIPATTPVVYEVYLSRDSLFDVTDRKLVESTSYTGGLTGSGDQTGSRYSVPVFDIPVTGDFVGGTYNLLFVVNREGKANLAGTEPVVSARTILFQKTNAPGRALDYGVTVFSSDSASEKWSVVSDPRATSGSAFETPALAQGESASIQYLVSGPTEINVPWKLIADSADSVTLAVVENPSSGAPVSVVSALPAFDPNTGQQTSDPIYRLPIRQTVVVNAQTGEKAYRYSPVVVPEGSHLVTWTYSQNTSEIGNFSRIDLDIPAFTTSGSGDWFGVTSADAKLGGNYARSPGLSVGQQAALEVPVIGPAQVSFWWRAQGESSLDTLAFYVDGELAQLPTYDANTEAQPAVISNQTEWRKVTFLIGEGPRTLRWVYSQGSENVDAQANVDALSVLTPVPAASTPNRVTNAGEVDYEAVPASNVDLAITGASAPVGTYLLDDAQGTSRLPIRVSFKNQGRSYVSDPIWDASSLELRLSTDNVWGNENDFVLGNYARFDVLRVGQEITFDVEVNLSFDIPDGTYYILARVRGYGEGSASAGEFTLANNTWVLGNAGAGNAYTIRRAPDLRLSGFSALEEDYPYHPEDAVYISYTIRNLGLGPVLPEQPFKVNVSLYALPVGNSDVTGGTLIRSYEDREFSLFLPPASAGYPDGAFQPVVHFIDVPSEHDLLGALGIIDPALPEDDARVYARREELRGYQFYFVILLDTENSVPESSETNLYQFGDFFRVIPVRRVDGVFVENAGSFYGDKVFNDFMNLNSESFSSVSFDASTSPPIEGDFTDYIWNYALYEAPFGSPGLLYQQDRQNSTMRLKVPPFGNDADDTNDVFQTISFDFNTHATDVEIAVQVRDDDSAPGVWDTIFTLKPPYTDVIGPRSLNGYGGLSSSPYVVSLDGNVSFVQRPHAARVTFRDELPVSARAANPEMRLVVTPSQGLVVPAAPTQFRAAQIDGTVALNWIGSIPEKSYDSFGINYSVPQGAYVIERARDGVNFVSLGYVTVAALFGGVSNFSFTDTAPGAEGTNTYRVRGVNAAGATIPTEVSITLF